MRRSLLVVLFITLVSVIFLLGASSTAMAASKKGAGPASASYAKKFHVAKTGKPKAPRYVPKQKSKKAHKAQAAHAKKAKKA